MTEDAWSLKNKKLMTTEALPWVPDMKEKCFYSTDDVEILRRKIMGNIITFCKEHYYEYDTSILELTLIINKRFGVKP